MFKQRERLAYVLLSKANCELFLFYKTQINLKLCVRSVVFLLLPIKFT